MYTDKILYIYSSLLCHQPFSSNDLVTTDETEKETGHSLEPTFNIPF